jgi:hypothetical protein
MKAMNAADYKEFRRLLYDYGKYDFYEIITPTSKGAFEKQRSMLKNLETFVKKHGNPGKLLHEKQKDLETYTVLSRIDEYANVKTTRTVKDGKELIVIGG